VYGPAAVLSTELRHPAPVIMKKVTKNGRKMVTFFMITGGSPALTRWTYPRLTMGHDHSAGLPRRRLVEHAIYRIGGGLREAYRPHTS